MSSTYRVLCLSHAPAIVIDRDFNTPDDAVDGVVSLVTEHPHCDLMIGRYSSPLIEVACLSYAYRGGGPGCSHKHGKWVESEWLRLLALAYDSMDPRVAEAAKKGRFSCWTPDRLRRLHPELGIEDEARERP
ncbi:hypothetical protein [Streptomyces anulatus]|uniref:hypothetical protein n=1 Tax=Streptomyces anulatus TaxID=1892 RepID=UPI0038630A3E|nr:hypothetical protein OG575_05615 [Streptomyces anulatus]